MKKTVTVTFMSGPTEKARQWTVPRWLFHAFFALGILCVIGAISLGFFYAYEAQKLVTYHRLINETREQKVHLDRYRKELERLEAQLSEVNLLDGQIRQMTAGQQSAPKAPRISGQSAESQQDVPATVPLSPPAPVRTPTLSKKTTLNGVSGVPSLQGKENNPFMPSTGPGDAFWDPPLSGWETSPFGNRKSPLGSGEEFHPGVDIAQVEGKTIKAVSDGYVLDEGEVSDYGQFVLLYHGLGVTSLYAHLGEVFVQAGDHVTRGTAIGSVGMSGLTNGPHLHFEIRYFGVPVDPDAELVQGVSGKK
ncbi:MAG: M23 family metallopeptidase [Leptospirales bacterium]